MSHNQGEANKTPKLEAPRNRLLYEDEHQFGVYSQSNTSNELHVLQQNQQILNQNSDWSNPYNVMGPDSGGLMVSQIGETSGNKMVYHQQMMPPQGGGQHHGWYGQVHQHQSNQMISHQKYHRQYIPEQSGSMMPMEFGHAPDLSKSQPYLIQTQLTSLPVTQVQTTLPMTQPHQAQLQPSGHLPRPPTESTSQSEKPNKRRVKIREKPRPSQKISGKFESGESRDVSVDEESDATSVSDDLLASENDDEECSDKVSLKKKTNKSKKSISDASKKALQQSSTDLSKLDENSKEVALKFKKGCECHDHNCFSGFDPEWISRHRLNIAELSKLEHDMYLMGVTMACLEKTAETKRQKDRKRLRAKYRFMGKEVCLNAFLYLDNTTVHQMKSIRKHITSHGITPRIHGNHRKKPHNTFSLDIYQEATRFLQAYFETHSSKDSSGKKKGFIYLSSGMTCRKIHSEYLKYCQTNIPDSKFMSYSTFRHFIKEQFPNLRFQKEETSKGNHPPKTEALAMNATKTKQTKTKT